MTRTTLAIVAMTGVVAFASAAVAAEPRDRKRDGNGERTRIEQRDRVADRGTKPNERNVDRDRDRDTIVVVRDGNTFTPGIDQRQANQARRIEQGLRDGSLTRREYEQLKADQDRIRAAERAAKADGHVSGRERQVLQQMLKRENRDIFAERHDNQERRRFGWRWWQNNGRGW